MWHPVGPLRPSVYWRRRVVVLVVLMATLAGLSWLGWALLSGRVGGGTSGAPAAGTSPRVASTPALERVMPSATDVRTPTPPAPAGAGTAQTTGAAVPCTDEMLELAVRAPAVVPVGSRTTIDLVVRNTSSTPCVRDLDPALQEIVLLDGSGRRVWGSNDCLSAPHRDVRTLGPGESVASPLVWSGRTSEPTCTAARTDPAPGAYVLRGRLDTDTSPDTPITLR